MLLTILLIFDIILTLVYFNRYKRYENALKEIASGEIGYTRMVSVALKALNNVKS